MKTSQKLIAVLLFAAACGLVAACDQYDTHTVTEAVSVVGKGQGIDGLGHQLAADPDFKALQKLVLDADNRAKLKYFAGASLKNDMAFAKSIERKEELTEKEQKRLSKIRGLSIKDFHKVFKLRTTLAERYPILNDISEEELRDALREAGVGQTTVLGKTFDRCSGCNDAYNSCVLYAQMRHAIEIMGCTLLLESVFGGTICYGASVSKYLISISSCTQSRQLCLSNNGCGVVTGDTA